MNAFWKAPSRRALHHLLGGAAALAVGAAAILGLATASAADAEAADRTSVADWIRRHARPLTTVDPRAPLTDLQPLHHLVRNADVVGLGESTHGAHEQFTLKHRIIRFLVEEMGFRSLALEEDWTKGIQLDEYVLTGQGEARALLADAGPPWQTQEILDVVRWMRSYNQQHPADPVRFVGVDIVAVRALAYDAVTEYVRRAAPDRLDELNGNYAVIRPKGDIGAHVGWYRSQPNKQPFIDHARQAYELVRGLPAGDGHALALQHARAIVSFYEYHALNSVGYRDQRMAENTIWWRDHTGDKVVYWASNPHTANGNPITISYPPFPPTTQRSAGAYLRDHFGPGYTSIGLTFHHGSVNAGFLPLRPYPVPAPPWEFVDATLGSAGLDSYILDLRAPQPRPVRAWLHASTKMRVIGPAYDPANDIAYHMSGGSLAAWFDVIIHAQEVTPTQLLAERT